MYFFSNKNPMQFQMTPPTQQLLPILESLQNLIHRKKQAPSQREPLNSTSEITRNTVWYLSVVSEQHYAYRELDPENQVSFVWASGLRRKKKTQTNHLHLQESWGKFLEYLYTGEKLIIFVQFRASLSECDNAFCPFPSLQASLMD